MKPDLYAAIDWQSWLSRWDTQQAAYIPARENRFSVMLDMLQALLPDDFLALDLACGPGSISQRLLARFHQARSIAIDLDPILLTMGRQVLGDFHGRLRWIEADLMRDDWVKALGHSQVDAVLSTTALHWLPAEYLIRVYYQLGEIVRPGGVVLNGDHLKFGPDMGSFQKAADVIKEQRRNEALKQPNVDDWEGWWAALKKEAALQDLFTERERRFTWRQKDRKAPIFDLHQAALRDAGFREVGVIWQNLDNRVLMAIR